MVLLSFSYCFNSFMVKLAMDYFERFVNSPKIIILLLINIDELMLLQNIMKILLKLIF